VPKRYSPVSGEVKVTFKREGDDDRNCALTKVATMNGYEVDVNNGLCFEPGTALGLHDRGPLGYP